MDKREAQLHYEAIEELNEFATQMSAWTVTASAQLAELKERIEKLEEELRQLKA